MTGLKIGVSLSGLKQPLPQLLKAASDFGAEGVQFDALHGLRPDALSETGRRQFLHLLDELGLKVASLQLPFRRTLFDLENLDARIDAVKSALTFAHQLRTPTVTARVGTIPPPDSGDYLTLRQVLGDLAAHGNRVGGCLAITPTHDSAENLAKLLGSINEGLVGIDLDPAGCVLADQNPAEMLRALHDRVLHIQARDAIREAFGSGQEVPLGRGEVDWSEFLPVTEEVGYRGWITALRTQGDDPLRDLANAVAYLGQLIPR